MKPNFKCEKCNAQLGSMKGSENGLLKFHCSACGHINFKKPFKRPEFEEIEIEINEYKIMDGKIIDETKKVKLSLPKKTDD